MNHAAMIVVLLLVVGGIKASKSGFFGRFGGAVAGTYTVNGNGA
ncbi:MAG TPA: hypothetical protein VMV41_00145 [Cellulomonadaceae bacterium]|nr:hypothetical protein [Cellulomonadaceae bacterium]